jgi:hypothetical protein
VDLDAIRHFFDRSNARNLALGFAALMAKQGVGWQLRAACAEFWHSKSATTSVALRAFKQGIRNWPPIGASRFQGNAKLGVRHGAVPARSVARECGRKRQPHNHG